MVEDPRGGFWLGTSNDGLFPYRLDADGDGARRYPLADGQTDVRVHDPRTSGDPEVRARLDEIRDVASESLADVRTLAHDPTPRQLEHLGLSAAWRR